MVERERGFEDLLEAYTYDFCSTREDLDKGGEVKKRQERCFEVFRTHGQSLERLVREDGQPLPPKRRAKEESRIRKAIERAARKERVDEEAHGRRQIRLSLVLERFDFTSVGREDVNGRPAVIVAFRAQPGKREIENDKLLRVLSGRLWIDEEARAVARAEFRSTGEVKFGGGLLASLRGLNVELDRLPIDDVWLPRRSTSSVVGRVLWNGVRQRTVDEYSNYRRFTVETHEDVSGPVTP
jgi:hypothetical protein